MRPTILLSLVIVIACTEFADAPSPSKLTRFAAEKTGEGTIGKIDFGEAVMPVRDEKIEMISCTDLGTDDDGNRYHAVMVQRDTYANMAGLATSAVNYAVQRDTDQFATMAVDLIGGDPSKLKFIGNNWTTMVIQTSADGQQTVRNIGQVSFNKLEGAALLAYEASNPNQVLEINSAQNFGTWFASADKLEIYAAQTYLLEGKHFNALATMSGSFLRRGEGETVVISDGLTNARFDFVPQGDERKLEFKLAYQGRLELAVDDNGVIDSENVVTFDGAPGIDDGLSLDRIELSKLPAATRDAIAA